MATKKQTPDAAPDVDGPQPLPVPEGGWLPTAELISLGRLDKPSGLPDDQDVEMRGPRRLLCGLGGGVRFGGGVGARLGLQPGFRLAFAFGLCLGLRFRGAGLSGSRFPGL